MDLISRESVIIIATSSCLDLDSYDDTDTFCDEINEIPSAFEGMTNGEVIQTLFPNVEVSDTSYRTLVSTDLDGGYVPIRSDWWNAPYKGGE